MSENLKKVALLLSLMLVAIVAPIEAAFAGTICFQAGQAESLTSDPSCAVVTNAGFAGWHQPITRDCDQSTAEGFVFHFNYPPDAPFGATDFTPRFWARSVGGGDSKWNVTLGCTKAGQNYFGQTNGSGAGATITVTHVANNDVLVQGSAIGISGVDSTYSRARCTAKVIRIATDAADTLAADAAVTSLCLDY
jgi:hypothetical protein